MCAEIASTVRSLPLSRHPIVSTVQADEAVDVISGSLLPVRIAKIADARCFRLDMNGCFLGRTFFGFNQFGVDTEVDVPRVEDGVAVVFGYNHQRPSYIEIDDERVVTSANNAAVVSPTHQARNIRPRQSGVFILRTSTTVLENRYREMTGASTSSPLVFNPSLDLAQGPGRLLHEISRELLSVLESCGPGSEKTLSSSVLEDALISVILGLPGNLSRGLGEEPRHGYAPWVVRRAEEYITAHAADPITLSHLVAVCGCSRSLLFDAFKSSRGYTPMQFLASRRLELARERLMGEPGATATEIALDCGFGNQGRFAKAYRGRFGESPSETLARCHGPMRH